jgi:fucose permease
VEYRGVDAETAAGFASLFFLGITFGRFLSGFIADRAGDKRLIRYGIGIILVGIILVGLPVTSNLPTLAGLVIIGLGCAPVYPSVIHATPSNFGADKSQAIIGIEMASAYTGTTLMPMLFGVIADKINIGLYPVYMLLLALLMLVMTEVLNRIIANKNTIKTESKKA